MEPIKKMSTPIVANEGGGGGGVTEEELRQGLATKQDTIDNEHKLSADLIAPSSDNAFSNAIEITWANLGTLINNAQLVPGRQYRIIDFNTTVVGNHLQAAGHQFDVIVTADSSSTLNENAQAAMHAGTTYFAKNNLAAWKLKYHYYNNQTKYCWTAANGTGVIYEMEDEFGNKCCYDFKNILFVVRMCTASTITWQNEQLKGEYMAIVKDNYLSSPSSSTVSQWNIPTGMSLTGNNPIAVYTFGTESYDVSLNIYKEASSQVYAKRCYNNIIGPHYVDKYNNSNVRSRSLAPNNITIAAAYDTAIIHDNVFDDSYNMRFIVDGFSSHGNDFIGNHFTTCSVTWGSSCTNIDWKRSTDTSFSVVYNSKGLNVIGGQRLSNCHNSNIYGSNNAIRNLWASHIEGWDISSVDYAKCIYAAGTQLTIKGEHESECLTGFYSKFYNAVHPTDSTMYGTSGVGIYLDSEDSEDIHLYAAYEDPDGYVVATVSGWYWVGEYDDFVNNNYTPTNITPINIQSGESRVFSYNEDNYDDSCCIWELTITVNGRTFKSSGYYD